MPEADRRHVELHLAHWPRCQERFQGFQAIAARLEVMGEVLPPVGVPASLRRRWEPEVLQAPRPQPGRGSVIAAPATAWLPGWLSQARLAWGAVALCWALDALRPRGQGTGVPPDDGPGLATAILQTLAQFDGAIEELRAYSARPYCHLPFDYDYPCFKEFHADRVLLSLVHLLRLRASAELAMDRNGAGGGATRRDAAQYAAERQEGAVAQAEQPAWEGTRDGMAWRGGTETDLDLRRKGDCEKLALAVGLRSQTTMTLAWLAARLSNPKSRQRRNDP